MYGDLDLPTKNRPFADSRFAKHLRTQILRMKGVKSQIEVATEAGFTNPNVISMLKNGATRMPFDRIGMSARRQNILN